MKIKVNRIIKINEHELDSFKLIIRLSNIKTPFIMSSFLTSLFYPLRPSFLQDRPGLLTRMDQEMRLNCCMEWKRMEENGMEVGRCVSVRYQVTLKKRLITVTVTLSKMINPVQYNLHYNIVQYSAVQNSAIQ